MQPPVCNRCNTFMEDRGERWINMREPGWNYMVQDDVWELALVFRCPKCSKLELYDAKHAGKRPKSHPPLTPVAPPEQ